MIETYLIFDLGTGNSRVALVSASGNVIGISSFENLYHSDTDNKGSKFFIPSEWLYKLTEAAKALINSYPECHISAVSATSAREGIVLIDKCGNSFIGLPNIDRSGASCIDSFTDQDYIYRISGRWFDPLFSALKLVAFRNRSPEQYENLLTFTSLSEWIGYELTGNTGISPSHACETQLYNTADRKWSKQLCTVFNIDMHLLPRIIESGESLGTIHSSFCKALNLTENTPFIVSGADTQTAVYGIAGQVQDTIIVSGTTSPIVSLIPRPIYDPQKRCWLDCSFDDKWQLETNAGTTGLNYQNYRNNFLPSLNYNAIEHTLKERTGFRCIASFGTKFFPENLSLKNGGFYMDAPFSGELDRFDLAKAILADIACGIALHCQCLEEIIPHKKDYYLGSGGGFQSILLGQWISNLTGKKIILRNSYEQASVMGCVRMCSDYFNKQLPSAAEIKTIFPVSDSDIHNYFDKWICLRKQLRMQT